MLLFTLLACEPEPSPAPPIAPACGVDGRTWGEIPALPLDDTLTVGDLQARATHNSTHQQPEAVLDPSWGYTQPTITDQLEVHGVRGLEFDLHLRDDGGLEVFHLTGIDDRTSCPSLDHCLREVCTFSAKNPGHAPIIVWMEPKDDLDGVALGYQEQYGAWTSLEAVIRSFFPEDRLYTPDDWRRGQPDPGAATATLGPPTLAETRGQVLFALLDEADHRADYLAETPDLAGRVLFVDDAGPGPTAALVKDASPEELPDLLAAGLLVTANVDSAGEPDNAARRDAYLAAGVTWAASDFPAESEGYWMELPGGAPVRCNPVTAPTSCTADALE